MTGCLMSSAVGRHTRAVAMLRKPGPPFELLHSGAADVEVVAEVAGTRLVRGR